MSLLAYFWVFLKASLFSSGGTGNLPSLHNDLIDAGAATPRQFAESLLIGQLSPGPTGLWSISLGYLTRGLPGAVVAVVAVTIPPFLVLVVDRLYRRVEHHPAVEGFVRGLSIAIAGVFVIILLRLLRSVGADYRADLIAAAAFGLAFAKRVPVAGVLFAAAVVGVIVFRH